jgi:hypothetical protein
VGGCGSTTTPLRPSATPTPSPSPTASPPPDVLRIDVTSTGVGTWQLIAVPVAIIHNAAGRTGVSGVVVDSPAISLSPGESLVVTSYQCTDFPCYTADGVTAAISPGTWGALPGAQPTATTTGYTCTRGCTGHGQWDVSISVAGPDLLRNEQVDLFASCSNAAGAIIGGGSRQLLWPQAGGALTLDVPVIVSSPPASCQVGATTST